MSEQTAPEFYDLLGRVTVKWSEAHYFLYLLFAAFTDVSSKEAQQNFFSRSDKEHRKKALAEGQKALADHPELLKALRETIKAVAGLAWERNAIVHAMWKTEWAGMWAPGFPAFKIVPAEETPDERLTPDILSQCQELIKKLHAHTLELKRIHDEYRQSTGEGNPAPVVIF